MPRPTNRNAVFTFHLSSINGTVKLNNTAYLTNEPSGDLRQAGHSQIAVCQAPTHRLCSESLVRDFCEIRIRCRALKPIEEARPYTCENEHSTELRCLIVETPNNCHDGNTEACTAEADQCHSSSTDLVHQERVEDDCCETRAP